MTARPAAKVDPFAAQFVPGLVPWSATPSGCWSDIPTARYRSMYAVGKTDAGDTEIFVVQLRPRPHGGKGSELWWTSTLAARSFFPTDDGPTWRTEILECLDAIEQANQVPTPGR